MLSRRSFIGGLIAAPAIVSIGNIMPVRGIIQAVDPEGPDALYWLQQEIVRFGHFHTLMKPGCLELIPSYEVNTLTPQTITCNGVVYRNPNA